MTLPTASADEIGLPVDDAVRIGSAWREMRRGASMTTLRERLQADVLDLGQLDALDLLTERDGVRMGDLASLLRVDASTATRTVDRLVEDGLAERCDDAVDGRRVVVRPSERGRQLHADLAERRRAFLTRVLDAFTPSERTQLADLMERLIAAFDEAVASPE